jgi:nitroimidazol reductase NimA-like FMN-containing flavoprotein (pyridoxamine 5'-phosphate oxidase superfamily)
MQYLHNELHLLLEADIDESKAYSSRLFQGKPVSLEQAKKDIQKVFERYQYSGSFPGGTPVYFAREKWTSFYSKSTPGGR